MAGEVWNDSEGSNWPVEDRTIEFRNDVCTASVSGNDYQRAKVSRAHLAIERLLNGGVPNQNEVTECESKVHDSGRMLLFEAHGGLDTGSVYIGGKRGEVRPMLLKRNCSGHNQHGGGKGCVRRGKKIRSFGDVEG